MSNSDALLDAISGHLAGGELLTERLSFAIIARRFAAALTSAGFSSEELMKFGHPDTRMTAEFYGYTRPGNFMGITRWRNDPARQAAGILAYVEVPDLHVWAGTWVIYFHGSKLHITRSGLPVMQWNGCSGPDLVGKIFDASAKHLMLIRPTRPAAQPS